MGAPRRHGGRILALALSATTALAGIVLAAPPAGAGVSVIDRGPLVGPAEVLRDGGESVRLGDRVLWLFGDTLYPDCDPVCAQNSAGVGDATGPTWELGAEFIPLTTEERAAWHSGDDRIAVWPTGAIRTGTTTAAVFFARYHVTGLLAYAPLGWGVATVAVGDMTATRVLEMPGLPYGHPVRVGRRVYAYGCEREEWLQFACKVARAPLAGLRDPAAWRYWTGAAWSIDPQLAAFVLDGPTGGLTVSWNAYLGQYLATYNLALSNRVVIRTAPSPKGPWSEATDLFAGLDPPAGTFDYAGIEHRELARDGGRVITVTYYHPLGDWIGEIRRVEVTLG